MLIRNDTPFAALGFGDLHRDGIGMAVVAVRGRYDLSAEGALGLADTQALVLNDVYAGDPHRTPLVQVGDLIPYKPGADVTVLGHAHAPGGRPARSWTVALTVGETRAALRVHGPRAWQPALRFLRPTWKLGPAEPATRVPLDYRLAAGGRIVGDPEGTTSPDNPIGPGQLHRDWSPVGRVLPAPRIEAPEAALADPFTVARPAGFGPVPPFWRWREEHCGTRDEAWLRERCPQMPADFDYRFFQTAAPALVRPRLHGDETVRLDGLVPGGALAFRLPGLVPVAHHAWFDGRAVSARLHLDGVHLDLRAEAAPWRVDLTWRGWVARCPAYHGAVLGVLPLAGAAGLAVSGEHGLSAEAGA
ncbi:DUF2169 family type VI secretion system accessory protein [Methylobacterium indicum]|nr:DUF2169 domain-containing protein [Methylobacterium indicum]